MNYKVLLSCVFISILSFQSSYTARVQPFTVQQLSKFFQEIHRFTGKFSEILAENTNGNLITSPISALIGSAILSYGAAGNTKQELDGALNLVMNSRSVKQMFHHFVSDLNNTTNVELHLANALFINNQFELKEIFRKISTMIFQSEINKINFQNKIQAAGIINDWSKQKTAGKIRNIVNADNLGNVELVMVNAVYFKGNWVHPFDKHYEMQFHLSKNNPVPIQMMCNFVEYNYNKFLNNTAWYIELPYMTESRVHAYSMYVILPSIKVKLDDIINQIFKINYLELNGPKSAVNFCMPKFEIASELELNTVFKKMGISDMFENTADFSGLTVGNNVKISKIIQKAFINVDEKGSEAAAANEVIFADRTISSLNINRPFVSVIVSKISGTPLFWARVNDPRS